MNDAERIKLLETKIQRQKQVISYMQDALRHRNLQLDAWHWVWCDGGCEGGVHRWKDEDQVPHTVLINENTVLEAERGAQRLRSWWENNKYRHSIAARTHPTYRTWLQRLQMKYYEWRERRTRYSKIGY